MRKITKPAAKHAPPPPPARRAGKKKAVAKRQPPMPAAPMPSRIQNAMAPRGTPPGGMPSQGGMY